MDIPAFPLHPDFCRGDGEVSPYEGMSKRDWFAGQALAGLCSNPQMFVGSGTLTQIQSQEAWVVEVANTLADAMIDQREKRGGQ
jgi:hypothetical protein